MKKQHDLEENIFGFVDISHRRYKLRRDVEQTPSKQITKTNNKVDTNTKEIKGTNTRVDGVEDTVAKLNKKLDDMEKLVEEVYEEMREGPEETKSCSTQCERASPQASQMDGTE
jgi:hypothetical protein